MSFQSSDFLPVYRNGEPYKATANQLKEYLQTGLDFAVTDHTHDEYALKDEVASTYLPLTGGTLTGALTLNDSRTINVVSGKIGNLKYNGNPRVGWGASQVFVSGELVIQDPSGVAGSSGVKMNSKRIYGLADPVNNQDAATKAYVDANAGGTLQPATSSVLGGVKIGSGVSVDATGKISVSTNYASSSHTHSYASASHNHGNTYIKSKNSQSINIWQSGTVFYIE